MWANIPGYEGVYQINRSGVIRSLTKATGNGRFTRKTPITLVPTIDKHGYAGLRLCLDGVERHYFVHRLVLTAFVRPPKDGEQACHNNGIRADNRLDNLRWDTSFGNQSDRMLHGTALIGDKNHNSKLTADAVREIRSRVQAGASKRSEARRCGVSERTIDAVISNKTWRHVCA
jgi:hypothetical protein